jgi:hypothetical protein
MSDKMSWRWKEWEIGALSGFVWGAFSTLFCIMNHYNCCDPSLVQRDIVYKVALSPMYLFSLILDPSGRYCITTALLTPLLLFPFLIGTIIGISVGVIVRSIRIRTRGRK